ncbi:MAG: HlyD family efflux transporter periplasmic adaptor subunit [Deltaproteobacteria bacterium]|nr:HlyD family efflux transporter periplasmic adaptor subunit [Deltaproteobacteria bacterium]
MRRRLVAIGIVGVVALTLLMWFLRHDRGAVHYTGFVEGEERILRSEVSGRVVEVAFAEGDKVPARALVARLADDDIRSRLAAKRQEVAVQEAQIRRQEEQVTLLEHTWKENVDAHHAELAQSQSAADLASRTMAREQSLVKTGASTAQLLDQARSARDQARSAVDRAHDMLDRTLAEEGEITVARHQFEVLRQQRELALAEIAELEVTHAKYEIRAPDVPTVVQTQFIWAGELAQPGTAILAVLDPRDKYVQVYVPVADIDRFRVGRRVDIELDSEPGHRVPGEVSFVANQATFTPEKIETRSDRLGQVYRAKVRILADVERFQPGTEGNVYVADAARPSGTESGAARASDEERR